MMKHQIWIIDTECYWHPKFLGESSGLCLSLMLMLKLKPKIRVLFVNIIEEIPWKTVCKKIVQFKQLWDRLQ